MSQELTPPKKPRIKWIDIRKVIPKRNRFIANIPFGALPDKPEGHKEAVLHFDGSCYPNPGGEMKVGYYLTQTDPDLGETRLLTKSENWGQKGTNNQAEYLAAVRGLRAALAFGVTHLTIKTDSLLMVGHMTKFFRVKAIPLRKYVDELRKLALLFKRVKWEWIPREQNQLAHDLASGKGPVGMEIKGRAHIESPPSLEISQKLSV